ncbi:hypothetical protein CMUS01_12982 [Colletotrichum musicola]|uniref:Uncharacterized protein n=1 Tax=Colletotrichum musicola TaxID=2175873 RepID=A0A8H6MXL0_9PEZI|nr:hypothetical protein CMUS01_12982 [Colletotrichum musicola]
MWEADAFVENSKDRGVEEGRRGESRVREEKEKGKPYLNGDGSPKVEAKRQATGSGRRTTEGRQGAEWTREGGEVVRAGLGFYTTYAPKGARVTRAQTQQSKAKQKQSGPDSKQVSTWPDISNEQHKGCQLAARSSQLLALLCRGRPALGQAKPNQTAFGTTSRRITARPGVLIVALGFLSGFFPPRRQSSTPNATHNAIPAGQPSYGQVPKMISGLAKHTSLIMPFWSHLDIRCNNALAMQFNAMKALPLDDDGGYPDKTLGLWATRGPRSTRYCSTPPKGEIPKPNKRLKDPLTSPREHPRTLASFAESGTFRATNARTTPYGARQ